MKNKRLIFVYNADSSMEHQVFDFLHKAISPSTYQCSLCSLTYGTFSMRKEWRQYIDSLPLPVEFLYKNQFKRYYKGYQEGFPAVLLLQGKDLRILVSAAEMKNTDLSGLKELLSERMQQQQIHP